MIAIYDLQDVAGNRCNVIQFYSLAQYHKLQNIYYLEFSEKGSNRHFLNLNVHNTRSNDPILLKTEFHHTIAQQIDKKRLTPMSYNMVTADGDLYWIPAFIAINQNDRLLNLNSRSEQIILTKMRL